VESSFVQKIQLTKEMVYRERWVLSKVCPGSKRQGRQFSHLQITATTFKEKQWMINFRVSDLPGLIAELKEAKGIVVQNS